LAISTGLSARSSATGVIRFKDVSAEQVQAAIGEVHS
jgi:hypothetical protein